MKKSTFGGYLSLLVATSLLVNSPSLAETQAAKPHTLAIGINVGGMGLYSTSLPFANIMKYAKSWEYVAVSNAYFGGDIAGLSCNADKTKNVLLKDASGQPLIPYDGNNCPIISFDTNGYPNKRLPLVIDSVAVKKAMQEAGKTISPSLEKYLNSNPTVSFGIRTNALAGTGGKFPVGDYTLSFQGKGGVSVSGTVSKQEYAQNDSIAKKFIIPIRVADTKGFDITITASDPANLVRDIKLLLPVQSVKLADVLPWCASNAKCSEVAADFNPKFLKNIKDFKTLRFMDWLKTNNNEVVKSLADATSPDYYSQVGDGGVSIKYIVALGNIMDKDIWLNIPPLANEDYVKNVAAYMKNNLKKNLHIYVEYANETWNSAPAFHKTWQYVKNYGTQSGLNQPKASFDLSKKVWDIWAHEFGAEGKSRYSRVIAGQFANPWTISQQIDRALETADASDPHHGFDIIAGAPYISNKSLPMGGYTAATTAEKIANDKLAYVRSDLFKKRVTDFVAVRDKYTAKLGFRVPIIMYEGGDETNLAEYKVLPEWGDALIASAVQPTMNTVFKEFYTTLRAFGVDGINVYKSVCPHTKFGVSCLLEYEDQATTPAYKATINSIRENGGLLWKFNHPKEPLPADVSPI